MYYLRTTMKIKDFLIIVSRITSNHETHYFKGTNPVYMVTLRKIREMALTETVWYSLNGNNTQPFYHDGDDVISQKKFKILCNTIEVASPVDKGQN